MQIFGVPIHNISERRIAQYLHEAMHEAGFHRIATVNPEFLLLADSSEEFKANLQRADLRVADGVGISLAFGLHGETLEARLPGADLLMTVLTLAAAHRYSVYLALRKDGLSNLEEIKMAIEKRFGPMLLTGMEYDLAAGRPQLPVNSCQILLCNFGAPLQEYFIEEGRNNHPSLRLGMGVGGAFDFLTGKLTRAPRPWQRLGLEWLWRLKEQPSRYRRILSAVFIFPWRVFNQR